MNNFSKFLKLFVTILILFSIMVGCSDSATEEVPPPTNTPVEEKVTEPTPRSEEGEPIHTEKSITILTDEVRAPIIEELAKPFTKKHGIDVEVQMVEFDDLLDTYKKTADTDEKTDILIGPHDWIGELVTKGLLLPIEISNRQKANFLPSAVAGFTFQDEMYGLPYAVENVALFYNTDLIETPPSTWSEVMAVADKLESSGKVKQGYIMNADPYHFYPIQTAFDGYIFGWNERGKYDPNQVGLDSEGSIAAAQWLGNMVKDGHLVGNPEWDTMYEMFESGDVAMLITGPWSLSRIRESGIPYGIANLPGELTESSSAKLAELDGLPFVGIQGFMINALSENVDVAKIFVTEFILSEETMQELFEMNLRPPAYLPTRRNIDDHDLAAFARVGSNGLPMPAIPEMSAVWDDWREALRLILVEEKDADVAFKDAADNIRALIE